jgi:CRP-like cAMP-binding protein
MKNHILVTLMQQLTPLTKEEALDIEESFPIKTVTKGTYLLKEGTISKEAYYIIKGCIRAYKLQEGEEKTTSFFTENQSVINFNSITNNIASTINFICEEETTIAILNAEKEKALYLKHPRFETFCRNGVEKMMGEKQEQQIEYISLKPEQRYLKLQKENPNLINRVPQYQIASYLGIKPETLSRIRARLVK